LSLGLNKVNAAVLGAGALMWEELENIQKIFMEN